MKPQIGEQFFPRRHSAQRAPASRPVAASREYTDAERALIESRREKCRGCPRNQDREFRHTRADAVACACRVCQAKPVLSWKCPLNRWELNRGESGERAEEKKIEDRGSKIENARDPRRSILHLRSSILDPLSSTDFPFSGIHVISLKRTPDRLRDFRSRWPADWPWQRPVVFEAVDGDTIAVPTGWNWHNSNRAAIGCRASWIALVGQLASGERGERREEIGSPFSSLLSTCSARPVLLMEDDCQLVSHLDVGRSTFDVRRSDSAAPDVYPGLGYCVRPELGDLHPGLATNSAAAIIADALHRLPPDWDLLFIGGEHNQSPLPVAPGIVRCRETGRTHCLAIHPRYFQGFLEDVGALAYHVDWALRRAARRRNFYAVDPFVAIQGANFSTLRNRSEPPRAWDHRVGLPPGETATLFHHAGDVGDIIYALPAIRAMTGRAVGGSTPATLILHPANYTRRRMTARTADELRCLLRAQPYIDAVEFSQSAPADAFDLNAWRWRSYPAIYNLADRALDLGGHCHAERDRAWLCVEPRRVAPVLFARSPRYHNPRMPWRRIIEKYPGAAFVGLPEEHREFEAAFGKVAYCPTPDYFELAAVIAGCELFVGNQSTPYAIAEAMKKLTIQEQAPGVVNCHFDRPGAVYVVRGDEWETMKSKSSTRK